MTPVRSRIHRALVARGRVRIHLSRAAVVTGVPAHIIDDAAMSVATWGCVATCRRVGDVVVLAMR